MKNSFDFVFVMIGPNLPYDVSYSAMVNIKDNKVVLVGGYSFKKHANLNTMLELDGVTSNWKETKLPLKNLRRSHIAIKGTTERMKIFCVCGK